ncbi:LysR family transcriptional regulator [Roseibium salinum]|uniref:LysR family transcriptional regulator n=1 Tax=Roseibium salinum TaxID=1604349 RepID=A0ABT3R1B8_9HYPH|nr:LysR family transcriptional regulator [Roseibium sp. DSM 29163]MCX2723039.1 LysR family transcriptional regulator [Roseibium sp. DSM 29163]MDN3719024.1 LysR family transcriptional regulator [Roseibium salinum]
MAEFDLNDLHGFGLIASAGGLSPASRRFGIPKATLSRSLHRIETAAGAPLFDRVGRGLRLTPLGARLLPTAESALTLFSTADEAMRAGQGEPNGPLRIAASALTGQKLLAPVLAKLAERYPGVNASLQVMSHGPDPVVEELDVVIRVGRPSEPYLVARKLVGSPLALYAFRTRAAEIDLSDPDAVEALGRIHIAIDEFPHAWELTNPQGERVRLTSKPLVAVSEPTVALGILSAGPGVAFLPMLYAEPLARAGVLVRALPGYTGPEMELFAALPPKRSNVPAVRVFLDLLVRHVTEIEEAASTYDFTTERISMATRPD